MKNITIICILVVLGAGSAAFATTTHHIWNFDDDNPMPMPDLADNGPGIMDGRLMVTPGPEGGWIDDFGAWELSGEIDILLDNDDTPRERKEIQIWLTWQPGTLDSFLPSRPGVLVSADPMASMTMDVVPLGNTNGWNVTRYDITIWPNPPEEWIAIKGNIIVDKVEIKTVCIPEPATMGLLGLGSLALLRNRRKKS